MPYLLTLVVPLGLFALYVSSRPTAFTLSRSLTIPASPEVLFGLIEDFHAWADWSPWDKIDPDLQRTYEGPASGVGAVYRWQGKKTGQGAMTLTAAERSTRVEIDLEFIKPFAARNKTVFTLEPKGDATAVTWTMSGDQNFMQKAFGVFMNMDAMVGKDFEKGLAAMRDAAAKRS